MYGIGMSPSAPRVRDWAHAGQRKFEDAAAVLPPTGQEVEHGGELRFGDARVAPRVVAVRAVADHIGLRRELLDGARVARRLRLLETDDVPRGLHPRDHAKVDQSLELRQLVCSGRLVGPRLAVRLAGDL